MTSSALPNQGQKYQGYPYVNPIVIDAPTIDAATASRWTNLPRRQLVPEKRASSTPVVYIDMPGNSASSTTEEQRRPIAGTKPEPDDTHVIYIDLPDSGSSGSIPNRQEVDARRGDEGEDGNDNNQREFVQETIFYDPFEDRRINVERNSQSPQPGSSASAEPPISSSTQGFTSKETYIYGSQRPDYSPPPLMGDFPEPPPAYTEIAPPVNQVPVSNSGSSATVASPELPRTEVIVTNPQYPIGVARSDRKLVSCQYCRVQVHTLAVKENGILTHVLACIFLIFFAPLTLVIYCTDFFKYVNHYCPNCNKLIGYEVPMMCQEMTYSKTGG